VHDISQAEDVERLCLRLSREKLTKLTEAIEAAPDAAKGLELAQAEALMVWFAQCREFTDVVRR
jgi:hypothetical protein